MRNLLFSVVAAAVMLASAPAIAGPAEDATAAVTAVLDKFNGGDFGAFAAAHGDNATIVDEFAPYQWSGNDVANRWGGDYEKDAKARGISGGRVDYGKPLQANSNGTSAYVVLPTTYSFQQGGRKMSASGSMTFVMTKQAEAWKIASWTYSGATPTPAH